MPGRYLVFLLITSLLGIVTAFSQIPGDQGSAAEELLYRDETSEVPSEILESQMDLLNNPIQLNTASAAQLASSGLFTPYQVHIMLKYRKEFGDLLSVYELAGLTGFRISRLREIERYLTVKRVAGHQYEPRGRDLVMINASKIIPASSGYQSSPTDTTGPVYIGSLIKTSIRIKTSNTRTFAVGLAYDKDAGESCFQGYKPEFISGYIQYQGHREIRKIIVGSYRLQHGLGLVNGSGFMHTPAGFRTRISSMSNLRPYASLNEYLFRRGAACKLTLGRMDLMLWASHQHMDLSTASLPDVLTKIDWTKYQRRTGLHRTPVEEGGRYMAFRFNSGIQVSTSLKNLALGCIFETELNNLTRKGMDSLQADGTRFRYRAFALHWHWYKGKIESFGEVATGNWNSCAMLAGLRYHFNDFFQGLLMLHHYDTSYRGMFPSSYAWGSNLNNERGLALHLHAEPGRFLVADLEAELFHHPAARYHSMVPSAGFRYSFIIQNPGNSIFTWKVRFVKKRWQTTPGINITGLRPVRTSEVTRIDARFSYNPGIIVQWQTRVVISMLSDQYKPLTGYAAVQQVGLRAGNKLKCTIQFVVFHINEWDNRIYLYEPGLYYDFNFPFYYGSGQKITTTISRSIGNKLTFSGKVSAMNRKCEVGLQLRLSL